MKIGRSTKRRGFPSLTPLVDMVFQLLIFFMLTSVAQIADFFPVILPDSETADEETERPAVILVGSDGALALDDEIVTVADIPARLANRQADTSKVLIKADGGAESGTVVEVLQQVNLAGVSEVVLATNRMQ